MLPELFLSTDTQSTRQSPRHKVLSSPPYPLLHITVALHKCSIRQMASETTAFDLRSDNRDCGDCSKPLFRLSHNKASLLPTPTWKQVCNGICGERHARRNDSDQSALQRRLLSECNDAQAYACERNTQENVSVDVSVVDWIPEKDGLQSMVVHAPTLKHDIRHAEEKPGPEHPAQISLNVSGSRARDIMGLTSTQFSGRQRDRSASSATAHSRSP
jgi:hypothetical protein